MKESNNDFLKTINDIEEFNKKVNTPEYFTSGKQTLLVKNLGKSKLGLLLLGILGIIFSMISFITLLQNNTFDIFETFKTLFIFLISSLFLFKGINLYKNK
ncbi:hypothetical protein [Clostridium intestinale]|uniref:hypothetical protein n=1 Tax=Clostridium intestinale TaxID=36845 RepID=UPI0028E403CE|nr:hypothetical protein [Clostridium intestinale]